MCNPLYSSVKVIVIVIWFFSTD